MSADPTPSGSAAGPAFAATFAAVRDTYCIWIVSTESYPHHHAFDEVADVLSEAFSALGGSAPVVRSSTDWNGRVPIVLGCHLLPEADNGLPRDAVLFNFEQVDGASPWMTDSYRTLLRRHPVLDYSIRNTRALQALGIEHVRHLPIRAMPHPPFRATGDDRATDVLFFGSLNERRRKVIEDLRARGLATVHLFGVYGAERECAVVRAKVVINVHYYEAAIFESARVCPLLARGVCVVSEGRADDPDTADLVDGLVLCDINDIVERCVDLVEDEAKRNDLARRGHIAVTRRSQADILAAAFRPT